MKKIFPFPIFFLGWIFICSFSINNDGIKLYEVGEKIEFDTIPYMYNDPYFTQAYDEIVRMLEGKQYKF